MTARRAAGSHDVIVIEPGPADGPLGRHREQFLPVQVQAPAQREVSSRSSKETFRCTRCHTRTLAHIIKFRFVSVLLTSSEAGELLGVGSSDIAPSLSVILSYGSMKQPKVEGVENCFT